MPNNQSNSFLLQHDCIQEEKIENIELDVKELKTKEDSLQKSIGILEQSVSGLKGSVDILKWIFGVGLPVLSVLLITIIGLLIIIIL